MTIKHGPNFSIDLTDEALYSDYLTTNNETRLLVINPINEHIFKFEGEFNIIDIIVANTMAQIPVELPLVNSFTISSAYPNPFNPVTTMVLNLSKSSDLNIGVYNLSGQLIHTLLNGYSLSGTYSLEWDATNNPSGVYFIRAQSNEFSQTQKIMLLK